VLTYEWCNQRRRAIEALEARAPPDSIATVVNSLQNRVNSITRSVLYNFDFKFTSIFYKIRSKLNSDILKLLYFAFVYSHLLYGIEIYGNTCYSYIQGWGPRGLSSTSRTPRGQKKIVALALIGLGLDASSGRSQSRSAAKWCHCSTNSDVSIAYCSVN